MPFGKMHSRNPEIIRYAKLIGRTPSALAMKLTNLASLDPEIRSTGRTVISVHGCFWHSHDCRWGKVKPETRSEFWKDKRRGTKELDARNVQALEEANWYVLVIWECQLKSHDELLALVTAALPPAHSSVLIN